MTERPVLAIAHRGDPVAQRENTLAAFDAALAAGADGVELDARHTADGALVVHHDSDVAGLGVIEEVERSTLPRYVPELAEVLDLCAGRIVNVEVKRAEGARGDGDRTAALVVRLLEERRRRAEDRVVVSSFAPEALDEVLRSGWIETAWLLPALPTEVDVAGAVAARGYRGVHPHHTGTTPELVERAHSLGLAVRVWTVNDARRAAELAQMGVDAIVTDDVEPLRARLGGEDGPAQRA
jgi:glycerophosphoryl diester phosphodiesterase